MPVYLAKRVLRVGDTERQPGQEVPEAAEWTLRSLKFWEEAGYIEVVPTPEEARDRLVEAGIVAPLDQVVLTTGEADVEGHVEASSGPDEASSSTTDPEAPWGRKKDGTPKRRPGRRPAGG